MYDKPVFTCNSARLTEKFFMKKNLVFHMLIIVGRQVAP
jgi:hypothetical protein